MQVANIFKLGQLYYFSCKIKTQFTEYTNTIVETLIEIHLNYG